MLGANGLKIGSKRAAFNDVSNVVKTVTAHDDLAIGGRKNVYDVVQKPTMLEDKPAGLLRPAQRPLTAAGLKSVLGNNTSVIPPAAVTKTSTNPIKPRVSISKRAVPAIYKDENSSTGEQVQLEQSAPSVAPVHQHLGPRHAKSQPQLKSQAPVLRRTQSKLVGPSVSMKQEETAPTASYIEVYDEQAVDVQVTDAAIEDYNSYAKLLEEEVTNIAEIETSEAAEQAAEQLQEENRVQYRHLPPLPLGSEPEEYWEEEEEELYDEQGYATGHSYRSRGDNNTTGGATTVLFPKVTSKITRELEVAKEITESSRSPVDVEDELWDTSMVAEYGDEIFAYMRELEVSHYSCSCPCRRVPLGRISATVYATNVYITSLPCLH
jgi:G2/mitotic-specific cyclin 3/4